MEVTSLNTAEFMLASGPLFGAIDVGSNAMRLGISTRDAEGIPQVVQRYREPIRLGHDAFTTGELSQSTMRDAVATCVQFRRLLDQHRVGEFRAVATSAMRESTNGQELARRIFDEAGIELSLISGEEEARLIHLSISTRVDLADRLALLIDMGGGSVEVSLCEDGELISAESFKIGTVRLLELLGRAGNFDRLLVEYLDGARRKLGEQIGNRKVDTCVATGGNATMLGELGVRLLGNPQQDRLRRKEIGAIIRILSSLTYEERIRDLGLRPDRADVILPAAMIFRDIMALARARVLITPDAGLLDGVILDMVESEENGFHFQRRNLLAWASSLKQKYHVDRKYGREVAALALLLFDQLKALHGMGRRDRLLLEIAGLVHEIGMYVGIDGHQRHGAYLISVAPLLGLSATERKILSQIVRYQRKAEPAESHDDFAALEKKQRERVWKLSAVLRLAIALNKERRNRVRQVALGTREGTVSLHLKGKGDMMLERWAALQCAPYFQKAFGTRLEVDLSPL